MADVASKRVNIYIDQTAAETALVRLQTQADKLNKSIAAGQTAGKNMVASLKQLDGVNTSIKKVQDQIDKGLKPSIQQQTTLVTNLRNELKRLSESDPQFATKLKNFQAQNAELQKMQANVNGVVTSNNKLEASFAHVLTRIGEYASIYAVYGKIKEFLTGSVEEAEKSNEAILQLQNTLKNTGQTGEFDNLIAKADALQKKFKEIDTPDIVGVFDKLITYGKLSQDQIDKLTPVIIDFAAKSKKSLAEASTIVIKALEGNSKALKEYGVNVKDGATVTDRFGILMDQLKPKVEGAAATFEKSFTGKIAVGNQQVKDLEETIGNKLLPGIAEYSAQVGDFAEAINDIFKTTADTAAEASAAFNDQNEEVQNLQKNIAPLADRYDELAAKAKLSTGEQTEMKNIIDKIVEVMPGAVTQFDKYGNAIAISTSRVRDFIQAEVDRLNVVNKDAIKKNADALKDINQQIAKAKFQQDQITKTGSFTITESSSGGVGGASSIQRKANQDEIKEQEDLYKNLLAQQNGYQAEIARLTGKQYTDELAAQRAADERKRQQNITTLTDLENQLKELQDARLQIDIKDTKSLADNAAKQKALQEQIDALTIKGLDGVHKTATEAAKKLDELKQKAQDFLKQLGDEDFAAKVPNDLLAMAEAAKKYFADIKTLTDDFNKHLISPDEFKKGLAEVEEIYKDKIHDLQKDESVKLKPEIVPQLPEESVTKAQMDAFSQTLTDQLTPPLSKFFDTISKNLNDPTTAAWVHVIEDGIKDVMNVWQTFTDLQNQHDERQIQKTQDANTIELAQYKRLLNSKSISNQTYQQKEAELNAKAAAQKEAIQRKEFERNKKIQAVQALINGATAVTATLAARPGLIDIGSFGVIRAIEVGLVVAETLAQEAAILSQHYAQGGKVHSGEKITTGQNIPTQKDGDNVSIIAKRGEVILNEKQQAALGGPSTFANIGVPGFAPAYKTRPYMAIDTSGITQNYSRLRFAAGGLVGNNFTNPSSADPEFKDLMNAVLNQLQNPVEPLFHIENYISLDKIDKAYSTRARIQKNSTLQ